jgi:methionyl-tRNA synthetase
LLLLPFLPKTGKKLQQMLGIELTDWQIGGDTSIMQENAYIHEPEILFSKIDDSMVEFEVNKLKDTHVPNAFEPQKEAVAFDDFSKMDIRLGTIISAQKVEKADKLLQLTVKTGLDERTIVSGIAEHYKPEEIIGKTVAVLLNLAPRKIRGIESQGMILMAENEQGELSFMTPEKAFAAGSSIR